MRYKEFLEYLETNLDGYHTFMVKAIQYQNEKNMGRPKKSRWNDEKIQRAAYDMWKKSMETLYNNLKREIRSDTPYAWTSYIEKHSLFDVINDSINELDFSYDAA